MIKKLKPYQDLSLQDIEGEEWRDIEGFEGYYMVSNMGRVKSLARKVWGNTNGGSYRYIKEIILKACLATRRAVISLHKDGNQKDIGITTLMRSYFEGEEGYSDDDYYLFHKDNNLFNNALSNLALLHFPSQNALLKSKDNKLTGTSKNGNGWQCKIQLKEIGKKPIITSNFKTELEAAHKYDYYIKKYNLKRKGNII